MAQSQTSMTSFLIQQHIFRLYGWLDTNWTSAPLLVLLGDSGGIKPATGR